MTKVFLIHGAYGSPEENWFPWLRHQLEDIDLEVIAPKFPTPDNQSLTSWREVFAKFEDQVDEDIIFVAHSLGPSFVLDVLEQKSARACFFVAGFIGYLNNPQFDKINKSFVEINFDWTAIKGHCNKFVVINSDNDPYVPIEKGEELAKKLGAKLITVPKAGHFNEKSGYTGFDVLLQEIIKEI